MAERVLSIEIGYLFTKVCEVERNANGKNKIFNSFVISTPEGMLVDGSVQPNETFNNTFKSLLSSNKIKTKKVIFTIASSKIATREAVVPFVKEKQLQDIVRANLSDYFPVEPSQYMFSHSIIGLVRDEAAPLDVIDLDKEDSDANSADGDESGSKKKAKASKSSSAKLSKPTGYKLMVLAAPKLLISSYEKLAKDLSLDIVSIDYNGNSIYQAAKDECQKGVQLIVKIDERNSLLMVTEDGAITLNRTIPYGIDEAVNALLDTTALGPMTTYNDALEVARRKTVIMSSFEVGVGDMDDDSESAQIRTDKSNVTQALRTLGGGILRVIDYYNSNHSQRPIEKAYITGLGADFSGLQNLLSNELGIKVKNLTNLSGIDVEKIFQDVSYGEYVTVIGATIAPINFYPDHDEEGKKSSGSSSANDQKGTIIALSIFLICVVASALLFLLTWIPLNEAKDLKAGYEKTIADCEPAVETYKEYANVRANAEYLKFIDQSGNNRNYELHNFITYLENEMPYTFCLNSIESDTEKITLDATVGSKEESAYVLKKLKENGMFSNAELTSVSLIENDLGEIVYGFTVDLQYAPYETEPPEDGEEAEDVEEEEGV